MRGRHRDLLNAASSTIYVNAEKPVGKFARRFASSAERHWDVAHPVAYWRADGSVYTGRIAPAPGRGWIIGFLLPVSLIGIAGAGVYRYGQPDSPQVSPETVARDLRDGFIRGANNLYKAASGRTEDFLTSGTAPIKQTGGTGACLAASCRATLQPTPPCSRCSWPGSS